MCLLTSPFICAWVNSDPRPLTLYLYLLSALFSFCWAMGTELWKQRAAACTNSLGSLARLFNPFHRGLTLMSPARLLQTCHHSRCTQDWHTPTYAPLNTPLHPWACLMTLFWCTLAHPWPRALLSFLPPTFFSSPFADPRGGIAGYEHERQEREHPGERYVTFKHIHSLSLCHTHSPALG